MVAEAADALSAAANSPNSVAAVGAAAAQPVKVLQLDLQPAGLGSVQVTMRLADGKLSVVVGVAKPATLKAIESEGDAISTRLAAGGSTLDSFVVMQLNTNSTAAAAIRPTAQHPEARRTPRMEPMAMRRPAARAPRAATAPRTTGAAGARRNRFELAAVLAVSLSSVALGRAETAALCEREMSRAARENGIPLNILYSVGLTETGHRGALSPWDMNVDGRAVHSTSLAEALQRFAAERARGARLIDVGCMQINQHWHASHFNSLAEMFDPTRNVDYAAGFLKTLKAQEGSWTSAVARYNAGPDNPQAQKNYVCAVIGNMVASGMGEWTPRAHAFCR